MLRKLTSLTVRHLILALVGYVAISLLIYIAFATYGAPFSEHQILLSDMTAMERFWNFQTAAIVMLVEIGIILLITKGYKKERTQMEKPVRSTAKKELGLLLGYLAAVQVGGLLLGKLLGMHAISFHLPGSLYGSADHLTWSQMIIWAAYNFIVYVVLPLTYFMKRRKYNLRQLNVISNRNVKRDIIVIASVLTIETIIQLGGLSDAILRLDVQDLLQGGLLAFVFNLFGTSLPAAIFIYALLFPRYQAVFKSPVLVIILGGLTYMIVHLFDSWMVFTSVGAFVTSLGALFLQYFMPGAIKSVLTYRTGNPWVHMWAYHAIAPHVIIDAPHFVPSDIGTPSPHSH